MSIYDAATIKQQIIGGTASAMATYGTAAFFGINPIAATIVVVACKVTRTVAVPLISAFAYQAFPSKGSKSADFIQQSGMNFIYTVLLFASHAGASKVSQYAAVRIGCGLFFSQAYVIGVAYDMTIGSFAEFVASNYIKVPD